MNELIIYFIKTEKYFHSVKEHEYYAEAGRVFQRYGMTVVNFFKKTFKVGDVHHMVEILQTAYMAPANFYCKLIHEEITSPKPTIALPYLLIDLQHSGLDTVMKQYQLLYEPFNASRVSSRFENGIKDIVYAILKKYEHQK
ncbi:hypothetical protein RF11_16241 [Thelohanellus kitauei]|uniref:Uncharacterized protein n=1 Tax=Thelohanellus kitauei TaxID=669202 RepID=A0A0C2MLC3_THEKT|nr:hypothetical protein RF11_16241 [Thelohanellus kitauei]